MAKEKKKPVGDVTHLLRRSMLSPNMAVSSHTGEFSRRFSPKEKTHLQSFLRPTAFTLDAPILNLHKMYLFYSETIASSQSYSEKVRLALVCEEKSLFERREMFFFIASAKSWRCLSIVEASTLRQSKFLLSFLFEIIARRCRNVFQKNGDHATQFRASFSFSTPCSTPFLFSDVSGSSNKSVNE